MALTNHLFPAVHRVLGRRDRAKIAFNKWVTVTVMEVPQGEVKKGGVLWPKHGSPLFCFKTSLEGSIPLPLDHVIIMCTGQSTLSSHWPVGQCHRTRHRCHTRQENIKNFNMLDFSSWRPGSFQTQHHCSSTTLHCTSVCHSWCCFWWSASTKFCYNLLEFV